MRFPSDVLFERTKAFGYKEFGRRRWYGAENSGTVFYEPYMSTALAHSQLMPVIGTRFERFTCLFAHRRVLEAEGGWPAVAFSTALVESLTAMATRGCGGVMGEYTGLPPATKADIERQLHIAVRNWEAPTLKTSDTGSN